jgi:hypothetical protein
MPISDQKNEHEELLGIPQFNDQITPEYVEKLLNIYIEGNDLFFNTLTGIDKIIHYIEVAYKIVIPPPLRNRYVDCLFYLFDKLVENETRARSDLKYIKLKPPKVDQKNPSKKTEQNGKYSESGISEYLYTSISVKISFSDEDKYYPQYWINKKWETDLPSNYKIIATIPLPQRSKENIKLVLLCSII